jgi:tRNA threonylcarbamoyladenosine biosynthesis protein TsaB
VPKNLLAIESAVGDGSISLWRGDNETSIERSGASRAERIIVEIDGLLRDAACEKNDLDLIAVSIGPGSYSGIRIGVSTALGLGHSLDIPVIGISVLEALASSVSDEKVIAVVPIGRNDLASQIFETDSDGLKRAVAGPILESITTFSEALKDHPTLPIVAPGYTIESLKDAIDIGQRLIDIDSSLASAIARLAARDGRSLSVPKPIYMRSAVAR